MTPQQNETEKLPGCIDNYVTDVRYCCQGGVYGDNQPKPCGYRAVKDESGEYDYLGTCIHSACEVSRSTDGFADDCRVHDEW